MNKHMKLCLLMYFIICTNKLISMEPKQISPTRTNEENLLIKSAQLSDLKTIKKIWDSTNINCQDKSGNTPLIIATYHSQIEAIKLLLNHENIEINLSNYNGESAIEIAALKKNASIVYLLAAAGADFSKIKHPDLIKQAQEGQKVFKQIFHLAVENYPIELSLLLNKGYTLNIKDENGNTPLHHAIIKNNMDCVRNLKFLCYTLIEVKNNDGLKPCDLLQTNSDDSEEKNSEGLDTIESMPASTEESMDIEMYDIVKD